VPTGGSSDRFDLPKNMEFTFIIRIFWQFHAVTALRCASFPPAMLLNSYVFLTSETTKRIPDFCNISVEFLKKVKIIEPNNLIFNLIFLTQQPQQNDPLLNQPHYLISHYGI
jgi:hypothetical protein